MQSTNRPTNDMLWVEFIIKAEKEFTKPIVDKMRSNLPELRHFDLKFGSAGRVPMTVETLQRIWDKFAETAPTLVAGVSTGSSTSAAALSQNAPGKVRSEIAARPEPSAPLAVASNDSAEEEQPGASPEPSRPVSPRPSQSLSLSDSSSSTSTVAEYNPAHEYALQLRIHDAAMSICQYHNLEAVQEPCTLICPPMPAKPRVRVRANQSSEPVMIWTPPRNRSCRGDGDVYENKEKSKKKEKEKAPTGEQMAFMAAAAVAVCIGGCVYDSIKQDSRAFRPLQQHVTHFNLQVPATVGPETAEVAERTRVILVDVMRDRQVLKWKKRKTGASACCCLTGALFQSWIWVGAATVGVGRYLYQCITHDSTPVVQRAHGLVKSVHALQQPKKKD